MSEERKENPVQKENPVKVKIEWCKGCGICYELCPRKVLDKDHLGKVVVKNPEACSKCRICEDHCPDYCIKIGG